MPLVRHKLGGFVSAGDEVAERLVASGFFEYSDGPARETRVVEVEPAQSHANASKPVSQGDATQDDVQEPQKPSEGQEKASKDERPDVGSVRAWAKANNIEVSAKGRVSAEVYDQYAEAHKN